MSHTTELRELKPVYHQRSNRGKGERITLKKIIARVSDREDKSDSRSYQYEFEFTVTNDGIVKLHKMTDSRKDDRDIFAGRLSRTLPVAERAVSEWVNEEDSANLALQPTYARLEMNEMDSCPPITNEKRASNNE
jgi:hypothetical protein